MQDLKLDPVYGFPLDVTTRKTIVILVEAVRSNINGDPDNQGNPRQDHFGYGIASHESIKRKIRDYQEIILEEAIHMGQGTDLGEIQVGETRDSMVNKYRDLRYFGGILTQVEKAKSEGKSELAKYSARVRGPIIVEDGITVTPLITEVVTMTRVAHYTDEKAPEKEKGKMGNRMITPYALYRIEIRFDASGAKQVQFSEQDLAFFWESLIECWENTRSTTRTGVNLRRVYCFDHANMRGRTPTRNIKSWVQVKPLKEERACRSWEDYSVNVDTSQMPPDMTLHSWEDGVTGVFTNEGPLSLAAK